MKTRSTPPLTPAQRDALEARFALRVVARLDDGTSALPHDITERLRAERALRDTEQKLADLAEETTGKPKKPAKPAKPAKTPFIDVGDGLLTEADMAANAKLADELEAKQREDEFKRNVEQAAQKLKAEAKADPKADPKAESKPKRKYTRKAKP